MDVQAAKNPAAKPEAAPAKLVVERFADGGIMCLKFSGMIDEQFEGKKLGASVECETLVLDLGGVKKISSFGIREWVDFATTATKRARVTILIECAPKVVDQLNMVANFTGGGRVFSFYTPFRCDYCDSEHRVLLQIDRDLETIKAMKLAERPCPACKQGMYFDDDGATYFSYMISQEKFALEPEVATFLASKLDYAVAEGARKLRVDKVIEGRVTYVRLAGDLDRAFPRDKLGEGLEGTVIIDVAAIGKVEPAGAAEWRSFVQMITPGVEQLYLFGVQPTFLEKLCGAEDLGKKAQVLSFALPYACKTCGTRSAHPLDVATHHEVLKFATAPELRCATCKSAMQCTATETSMTILASLPKPSPAPELVKSLGVLRERAVQISKPKQITAAQLPIVVPTVSPIWTKIAIALGVAVLALAGIVVYRLLGDDKPTDKGAFGVGPLVDKSDVVRPAWVGAPGMLGLGSVQATKTKAGLVGVAVSSMSSSQQDAEDDAFEAAVDGIAAELARLANDSTWFSTVPPIYEGARSAKLAALARDPASTQSRKEVRDGRGITSYRLRSDGFVPAITGKYREVYDTAEGRRYVAYVQVTMFQDDAEKLAAKYAAKYEVLGATVVRMFPLVGWRHKIDHGAIVIGLANGPFKDIGLAERYIVQSINGRDPAGIESFVKIATEEYAQLQQRGGTLRLKVQAEDGAMREFTAEIKATGTGAVTPPDPKRPGTGSGSGKHTPTPTGGVNVWDKYGGNKGSGRDDPTQ
ncbi:MAG: hypothetical protein H0T79_03570 [Deltaproteobacteria bacterium]|nr:hypothetical protein [Deltaproteobacteria bacterium]